MPASTERSIKRHQSLSGHIDPVERRSAPVVPKLARRPASPALMADILERAWRNEHAAAARWVEAKLHAKDALILAQGGAGRAAGEAPAWRGPGGSTVRQPSARSATLPDGPCDPWNSCAAEKPAGGGHGGLDCRSIAGRAREGAERYPLAGPVGDGGRKLYSLFGPQTLRMEARAGVHGAWRERERRRCCGAGGIRSRRWPGARYRGRALQVGAHAARVPVIRPGPAPRRGRRRRPGGSTVPQPLPDSGALPDGPCDPGNPCRRRKAGRRRPWRPRRFEPSGAGRRARKRGAPT
jgi:hypothetical protein